MSKLGAIGLAFALSGACISTLEATEKSDRLVQVLQYDEQLKVFVDSCFEGAVHTPPEDLLKNNPYHFGGFNPNSPEWPLVLDIYNRYFERACEYVDTGLFKKAVSEKYASTLNEQELDAAIQFYSTPVGQKIVSASVVASRAFDEVVQKQYAKYFRKANLLFQQEISDLVRQSQLQELE